MTRPRFICAVSCAPLAPGAAAAALRGAAVRPRAALLALLLALAAVARTAEGQQTRASEYDVKAVYLFNFSKFVAWPQPPAGIEEPSFAICVLGKDPFGAALDRILAGERIAGISVVARRVGQPQEASSCRVVFISSSEENRLRQVLAILHKTAALTVSDIPGFAERGGMIEFVLQGGRVRFEVNLASALQAGLTLSSELLKVAVAVRHSAPQGG